MGQFSDTTAVIDDGLKAEYLGKHRHDLQNLQKNRLVPIIAQMLSARQTLESSSPSKGLNIHTKLNSECKCVFFFVQDLCEYRKTA